MSNTGFTLSGIAGAAARSAPAFAALKHNLRQTVSMLLALGLCLSGAAAAAVEQPAGSPRAAAKKAEAAAKFKAATGMAPEDVALRQDWALDKQLAALQPQRPGKVDLYYIGFAGDGKEKVFSNDVRMASVALGTRYGSDARSLLLINNTETLWNTPIADARNLQLALQAVAARMDKQQDVLFLFLSSHGAKDHRLSVDFPPLPLEDLKAEQLKAMLDQSGIRNRVIAVSACYSGGFLDVLQDDNSLILTASARDREARGCGDATQFTTFAETYFRKSLESGGTMVEAFAKARKMIEASEKRSGGKESQPQIYVGRNIAKLLPKLEAAQ